MKKTIEDLIKIAESFNWKVISLENNIYEFESASLGFGFEAPTYEDFIAQLFQVFLDYDVSKVTFELLDSDGRGGNNETLEEVLSSVKKFKKEIETLFDIYNRIELYDGVIGLFNILIKVEQEGWSVDKEDEYSYRLSKYSPAGYDFSFNIDANSHYSFISKLRDYYNSFDESEEAYLWLDSSGHGRNGAPHHMRDVLDDMVACKKMVLELYDKLTQ